MITIPFVLNRTIKICMTARNVVDEIKVLSDGISCGIYVVDGMTARSYGSETLGTMDIVTLGALDPYTTNELGCS